MEQSSDLEIENGTKSRVEPNEDIRMREAVVRDRRVAAWGKDELA